MNVKVESVQKYMGSIFLKKQFKIEAKNKTAINLKAVKIKSYGASNGN